MKLKITAIGNSAGVILPKELLARLRLEKGDDVYVLETPDGIRLTAYDPELAAQMDVAEQVMRERRDLLRKLASEQDACIIAVTHDEKIFDRFDRIFHLRDGRLDDREVGS